MNPFDYFQEQDPFYYEDYLMVLSGAKATQGADGLIASPAAPQAVLTTACDVQDDAWAKQYSATGDEKDQADAVIYVPSGADLTLLESGMRCEVEYQGLMTRGRLTLIEHYERRVFVKWQ